MITLLIAHISPIHSQIKELSIISLLTFIDTRPCSQQLAGAKLLNPRFDFLIPLIYVRYATCKPLLLRGSSQDKCLDSMCILSNHVTYPIKISYNHLKRSYKDNE